MSYQKTVNLKHHESLMVLNKKTGEVKEVKTRVGNSNMIRVGKGEAYHKNFTRAWKILRDHMTREEHGVAHDLALLAAPFHNVLPFDDTTTIKDLSDHFNIDRRRMKKILDKLYKLGIYGKWEIHSVSKGNNQKSWVFNPYLFFNGTVIDKTIVQMFQDTFVYKIIQ